MLNSTSQNNIKYSIKPFLKVGNLYFGTKREVINQSLNLPFKEVFSKTLSGVKFVTDHYEKEGLILGYLNPSFLLRYVILTDPCEAFFENKDLLAMNYAECLAFMRQFDEQIIEEEYVGFTSYKYGIAIYAPNGTEDSQCEIEAVTIGAKGYFISV